MKSITNLLTWLDNNWTLIVIIIVVGLSLYKKITSYIKLSNEEKIEAALKALRETLLCKMSNAEIVWETFKKSGDVKRSEVLEKIYTEFPVLKTAPNQNEIIEKIVAMIDDEMDNMNRIINGKEKSDEK